jgi:hypothetical protein
MLLRTPAAAPAILAVAQQGPDLFFPRTRTGAGTTLRPEDGENPQGEIFSRRDLPSMIDYRVHYLVTD